MRRFASVLIVFLLAITLPSVSLSQVPTKASDTRPLQRGAKSPMVSFQNSEGKTLSLKDLTKEQPILLVFYRGGWCPYCNQHLGALQKAQKQLSELGYKVYAVSPDRPAKLKESASKQKLSYTLLSDSKMDASKAFGLAFRLDPALVKKYKDDYKIDIEADSGETHHMLPVPAAYIIDDAGVIQYSYSNSDYKVRVDIDELLIAARESARPF